MPRTIVVLLLSLTATVGNAQGSYPEQPVRILVGFTAGVAPDVTGRLLAEKLGAAWGKPVVVENITGAGGNIATDRLAKSPPNGYTLGMIGNGSVIFSPSLYDKLSFDPVKDLAPISQIFVAANVLVVPSGVPAKTLPELVAPELPTMAESGYPGFEAVPWFGLMAPAGTPGAIVELLHRDTVKVLAQPDVRRKMNDLGLDVIGGTPVEFAAAIERETPRWARVIRQAGIKASD